METVTTTVQGCGCIALPEAAATGLGMMPGSELSVETDGTAQTVTLRLLQPAHSSMAPAPASCPLEI